MRANPQRAAAGLLDAIGCEDPSIEARAAVTRIVTMLQLIEAVWTRG